MDSTVRSWAVGLLGASVAYGAACGSTRTFAPQTGEESSAGGSPVAGAAGDVDVEQVGGAAAGGAAAGGAAGMSSDDVVVASSAGAGGEPPAACTDNACGGCVELQGRAGDRCRPCGVLVCTDLEALECESVCEGGKPVCDVDSQRCVECDDAEDCTAERPVCHEHSCLACAPSTTRCERTTPWTCNAAGSREVSAPVQQGVCGAVCDPGALGCNSQVGQKCAPDGKSYMSSGSNAWCTCSQPGRFRSLPDGNIHDAQSDLTWDYAHAADTQAGAAATCAAKGMRLPGAQELQGLLVTGDAATSCNNFHYLAIDSVAFPSIVAETRYWTGTPAGFPGTLVVVFFVGSSTSTTDRQAAQLVDFLCVQSP